MFKKIISTVLALAMMVSMGTSVFADGRDDNHKPIVLPTEEEFSKDDEGKGHVSNAITPFAYTATAAEVESNNTMGTADSISLTSGRNATISSSSDVDWFVFTTPSSGNFRFDLSDMPSDTDYEMVLYNNQNVQFQSSSTTNPYETIISTLPAGQQFYFRVYSYRGSSTQKYYVTVTNDSCALLNWQYPFVGSNPPRNVSSPYGYRTETYAGDHFGVDLDGNSGVNIYCAASGTLQTRGANLSSSMGYYAAVKTSSGNVPSANTVVTYMHMAAPTTVSQGAAVNANTLIGTVGGSGNNSLNGYGHHLHLQVSTNGNDAAQSYSNTLNPLRFFPNINFKGNVNYTEKLYSSNNSEASIPDDYYMLDQNLVDYVGIDAFEQWRDSAEETSRSVPGFLEYFGISDETCLSILSSEGVEDFYEMESVFAFRDMQ